VSTQVNLEAGKHIIQLRFGDAFNLDYLTFTKQ
jgi:arabinoxylan arabinofuranohydrolase